MENKLFEISFGESPLRAATHDPTAAGKCILLDYAIKQATKN